MPQSSDVKHYNQKQKRKVEFFMPPNRLKEKVGSGGLDDDVLDKAENVLQSNNLDFAPLGKRYLAVLGDAIKDCKTELSDENHETLIIGMLYPAMQLKANGGMFQYPLITIIADNLIQFLEVIETPDIEALEIVEAYKKTIKAIITEEMKGDTGQEGKELSIELTDACFRYFEKHPDNLDPETTFPN